MTYISPTDDAWDNSRICEEQQKISQKLELDDGELETAVPWASVDEHPISRYHSGKARYDLSTVSKYLLAGKTPTEFKLRRAPLRSWGRVMDLMQSGRDYEGRLEAIALTLEDVSGFDFDCGPRNGAGKLSDSKLEELRELLGDRQFNLLALACISANAELTYPESSR